MEKWFSLRDKLFERGVDIQKVDEIIRNHHEKMRTVISEWIAAKEFVKKSCREIADLKLSEDEEKLANSDVGPLLKGMARELRDRATNIVGPGGLRKLTRKKIRSWPIFTQIIKDLYGNLFPFFRTRAYDIYGSGKNPEWAPYPTELLQVIASLLHVYYPSYLSEFTADQVKARVQSSKSPRDN